MQIARLVCGGLTSRQIADELVLSIRTVDNHLRKVYRALDVAGRGDLAEVLADAVG
jgi:DNA-binding CsgD family transcriptional regulator